MGISNPGATAGRVLLGALVAVGLLGITSIGAGGEEPERHRIAGGKSVQWYGARGPNAVAWTQGALFDFLKAKIYVRGDGDTANITPYGEGNVLGGIDGNSLVFERYKRRSRLGDVWFYNLINRRRHSAGRKVNTADWERGVTLSGNWLLFERTHFNRKFGDFLHDTSRLFLFNTKTRTLRLLDKATGRDTILTGQVNQGWVAWAKCARSCWIFRYNIDTRKKKRLPSFHRPVPYALSVSSVGDVYFAESGFGCGTRVDLAEYPIRRSGRVLLKLKKGLDVAKTYVYEAPDETNLVYDLDHCSNGASDIYELTWSGASTTPTPSPTPTPTPSETCIVPPVCSSEPDVD